MNYWNFKTQKALAVAALIMCMAALFAAPANAMSRRLPTGGQTQTIKLDSGFAQVIATNKATAVQGGTIADAGLFNGPVMVQSARGQLPGAKARVLIGFNFGADAAPNAAQLDEETSTLKNDLGRIINSAKANPQAAAALALLEGASAAIKPGKALPLGDRTAGQGYMLMEGESADVKEFGIKAVDGFVDARSAAHGVPRAVSTETHIRTLTATNDAAVVIALGQAYIDYLTVLATDDAEEPEPSAPAPRKDDGNPDVPDAGVPQSGSNVFLWKPVSDSSGKLVVILPASLGRASTVTVNGDQGTYSATANGNRAHYRFDKPGSSYGAGAKVVATFPGGKTESWTIADGGKRTEVPYKGTGPGPVNPPPTPDPVVPAPTTSLFLRTPASLSLRADFAVAAGRIDALTNIVETSPGVATSTAIPAFRSGNIWTLPKDLASYPTGNRPNTWRIRLVATPPAGVTYHTSIMQTFIRVGDPDGKTYPPSTRS